MKSYLVALLLTYLLPPSSVIRRTALALQESAAPVRVTGTLIVSEAVVPGLKAVPAVLTWRPPGDCRLASLPNAPEQLSWSVEKDSVVAPEAIAPALRAVCSLLAIGSASLSESRTTLERRLTQWGVDTRKLIFSRVKTGVIYEFGAAQGAKFGVFKDTFFPARLQQGGLEVLLSNYANLSPGATIPRNIDVVAADDTLLSFSAISVDRAR